LRYQPQCLLFDQSFNTPEEIGHFDKGKVEVVRLGDVEVIRVTNQPGGLALV
jgi:hypothetical protein